MKQRFLVCAGVMVLALAGCSDDTPAVNATGVAPTVEESLVPQSGPAPTKPGASPQAGCPVDAATLEKAFAANAQVAGAVIIGKGLKDVTCADDWATARTQPDAMDTATVLFQYDTAKKQWFAIAAGTDNICTNKVPAAIIAKLKNCGS